ncbi:hypothetical protein TARUN_1555 [Trichoderma arundinaceum]|uniref:Uncharacterized protein n=1 Tax=Trichoderma arundinaceum TaxID=490622 RepID=A0A395NX45_TRIAR|nr:hypothetical protein TARUN_1555 [Trichoderma arundinaceum]
MHIIQLLLAASSSAAALSSPLLDQEVITNNQYGGIACVFGAPKKYDQWTISYQEVKPSLQSANHFILDPAWVERHQTVGDADSPAEHSTPDNGEFSCYFFDALIQPEHIVPSSSNEPYKMTHAYNRLCDNEMGI